jgi:N-acetylglucosaminyl-diphospho-decaprenol L-rhamnosyltransferase
MSQLKLFQKEITILIILFKEEYRMISNCLENIKNFKVIIIDNANDEVLKKRILKKYKIYKYILNKKNIGFASAAYQGINLCETSHMLFLTADCYLTEENIFYLYEAKKKYLNCMITSPTFYDEKGFLTYNGGPLPENGNKFLPLQLEGDTCVESVITTAILFNVNELKMIGSIDPNFFIYFMDDELCRRIKMNKKYIIQVFKSKAIHKHGNLKVIGNYNKIFVRNFHFTYDELYYYYRNNTHHKKIKILKKKIYKYILKFFLNLFFLRFEKSVYYLSKTLAFFKFILKF